MRNSEQIQLSKMFYWNSQDASNLFGVTLQRPEDDVRDVLRLRIKQLQFVSQDHNGWQNVIEGRDPDNICSGFDIFSTWPIFDSMFGLSNCACTHEQVDLGKMLRRGMSASQSTWCGTGNTPLH
jgi:hypothetical protein